jgi:hypothetical protein
MRTLRSLVTVIVRQPPRPVPLYFVDFASKSAWHAPFRVLPYFLSRKLLLNRRTVQAKHSTPGREALASDGIAEILRLVSVISLPSNEPDSFSQECSPQFGWFLEFWKFLKRRRINFGARTLTPPKFRILAPQATYFAKCCLKKPSVKDSARSASGLL